MNWLIEAINILIIFPLLVPAHLKLQWSFSSLVLEADSCHRLQAVTNLTRLKILITIPLLAFCLSSFSPSSPWRGRTPPQEQHGHPSLLHNNEQTQTCQAPLTKHSILKKATHLHAHTNLTKPYSSTLSNAHSCQRNTKKTPEFSLKTQYYIWASVKNKESSGDSLSGHSKVKEKKGSALSPGGKRKSTHPQKNYAWSNKG